MTNYTKYALGAVVVVAGMIVFMFGNELAVPLQNPVQIGSAALIIFGVVVLFRSARAEIRRRALAALEGGDNVPHT